MSNALALGCPAVPFAAPGTAFDISRENIKKVNKQFDKFSIQELKKL
jgi:hypothetical protein